MAFGRYEDDKTDLRLGDRVGQKFINTAKQIFLYLRSLEEAGKVEFDARFPAIVPAVDTLNALWVEFEKDRPAFELTADLRRNYEFAKRRYYNMKKNPTAFYESDNSRRQELEKEKAILAEKIKDEQLDLSRAEDVRRLDIKREKQNLTAELAVQTYKKHTLEEKLKKGTAKCLPCGKSSQVELDEINNRITEIEGQLKLLEIQKRKLLDDKRYQLRLLHKRRWDVDRALNAYEQNAVVRVHRWQNAVDNAEVVMFVRRMEIDDAIDRHYARFTKQLIHAFLIVYASLKDRVAEIGSFAQDISSDLSEFDKLADIIHCPEIASRSVETLYKKIQLLENADQRQVVGVKPERNKLPEALERTFSVKNFRTNSASLVLFRKVLPDQVNEDVQGDSDNKRSLRNW